MKPYFFGGTMEDYRNFLWTHILPRVQKATRYMGNEFNSVRKDHSAVSLKVALAFPDLYEVGMSHLGLKILYHIINTEQELAGGACFCTGYRSGSDNEGGEIPALFTGDDHTAFQF
jgi:hypothetical protein